MPRVRRDGLDAAFVRVQAHRPVAAELVVHGQPFDEQGADAIGQHTLFAFPLGLADLRKQSGHRRVRAKTVCLDFGECDRRLGQHAVAMRGRIR